MVTLWITAKIHFHYETNLSELTFIPREIISDDLRGNKN